MNYDTFLERKTQLGTFDGFKPVWMPDFLFDFQASLVQWAIEKGKASIFAGCGLGKSPMSLVWAENVVRKTNGRVLIATPIAVGHQFVREGEKFGIECKRSTDGSLPSKIVITNYERLLAGYFNPNDFEGMVCDESGILKNFDGETKKAVTDFMRKMKHRLLCSATPAPNDFIELGTSSEALGELGFIDMIQRFFKSVDGTYAQGGHGGGVARRFAKEPFSGKYRFRGHAERDFWRWVVSWARAVRKPSDLGFSDEKFVLPPLITNEHIVSARTAKDGCLFDMPAVGLKEQREERRRTINERCELAAQLANHDEQVLVWCDLNTEGKLLTKLINGAVEICGDDSEERKEEVLAAFESGELRALVSKQRITGYGLNLQNCHREVGFVNHSFESWFQAIRRCWRFGQKNAVTVDMVCSEGERGVLSNLKRKQEAAEHMFESLVMMMNNELQIQRSKYQQKQTQLPSWLSKN